MKSPVQTFHHITSGGVEEIVASKPYGLLVRCLQTEAQSRHGRSTSLAHPFLDLSILPLDFSTTLYATLDVISALIFGLLPTAYD
jgi:hypothetical protein